MAGTLGLILALAAGLRIWGMSYGLPHPMARPDEQKLIGRAVAMLASAAARRGPVVAIALMALLSICGNEVETESQT